MSASHLDQRRAKAFTVAELAYDSIKEALFHLETMKPLISDRRILDPLDRTYAANTLQLLQWTLFGAAALNLCKAIYDRDARSGSLAVLFDMLGDDALVAAIRSERTEPIPNKGRKPEGINSETWAAILKDYDEQDRATAEAEFDAEYPQLRPAFDAIRESEPGQRLRQVRNKVLAHDSVRFRNGNYSGSLPEDFGLRWGDAEAFAKAASKFAERVFRVLFGHHLAIDQARDIYRDYSQDFWSRFRADIDDQHGN